MNCPYCAKQGRKTQLVKSVEGGGVLMRGTAPIVRLTEGRLTLDQRCPVCRRLTRYQPIMVRVTPQRDEGD